MIKESAHQASTNGHADALMNRIRERVRKQKEAALIEVVPSDSDSQLAPLGVEKIVAAQAEFNRAFVRSVELMAKEMDGLRVALASVDERIGLSAENDNGRFRKLTEQVNRLYASFGEINQQVAISFGLTEDLGKRLDELHSFQAGLEQTIYEKIKEEIKGELEKELQQKSASVDQTLAEMNRRFVETENRYGQFKGQTGGQIEQLVAEVRELKQKTERNSSNISEFEQKLDDRLRAGHKELQAQLAALEGKFQEGHQMAEAVEAQAAGLESKLADAVSRLEQKIADVTSNSEQKANEAVAEALASLQAEYSALESKMREEKEHAAKSEAQSQGQLTVLGGEIKELSTRLNQFGREVESFHGNWATLEEKIGLARDELKIRILRVERALKGFDRGAPKRKPEELTAEGSLKLEERAGDDSASQQAASISADGASLSTQPFDYFMFEHSNRGSIADIKHRQSKYLNLFLGRQNVLDLGCGRGEFLDLLSENGVPATGVDNNLDMVDFCLERGLRVIHADMFEYLESLPDASLDGIFSAQVVEHISPEQIIKLTQLCGRKLMPQAVLVVETVNTNCPEALSNFYLDPTHVRPVPAKMLQFIYEQGPFKFQNWMFSAPVEGSGASELLEVTGDLPKEIELYRDYAAVAVRR